MFLILAIGLGLFSLSLYPIMVNAHAYPSDSPSSGSSTNGGTHVTQMAIVL